MPRSGSQPTLGQLRLDAAFPETFREMRLNRRELDRYFGPTLWLVQRAPGMEANTLKRYNAKETDQIPSYGAWCTLAGVPTAIGSSYVSAQFLQGPIFMVRGTRLPAVPPEISPVICNFCRDSMVTRILARALVQLQYGRRLSTLAEARLRPKCVSSS